MSKVGRLAGAILVETEGAFYLVGDLKEPCDFPAAGFEPPGEIDAKARPYIRLMPTRAIVLSGTVLKLELEGEALAQLLAERLVIQRNGSVSDRLWRIIVHSSDGKPPAESCEINARWLSEIPAHLWQIVRDQVLKCS